MLGHQPPCAAPGGAAVAIGDAVSGVGRISGGGERLEQVTEGLLLLAQTAPVGSRLPRPGALPGEELIEVIQELAITRPSAFLAHEFGEFIEL